MRAVIRDRGPLEIPLGQEGQAMRARATAFVILGVTATIALPALGHAQSPAVTRGVLRGTLSSPDTTTGVVRGAVPPGATGLLRGSLPPGGTAGLLQRTPAGAKVGALQDTAWAATVPVLPGEIPSPPHQLLRGPLVPGQVSGVMAQPVPPDARFGESGPRDLAETQDLQARMYLVDGNFAHGEGMLNRSVGSLERVTGGDHPEVVTTLEVDAQVMRHYDRQAAAADMEGRAGAMRKRLEPPPAPKKTERF
jgi:hypothetical protein